MGLRVVFFGTPEFAATVLRSLLDSPHEVVAAVTAPERPSGRGRRARPGAVASLAGERRIDIYQPATLRDPEVLERLGSFGADVFAVASYGLIFSEAALAVPRLGAVNVHASILPALRGAAPVERAILAGLQTTGVSVQRMVRTVDAGDVYAAVETPVDPRETAGTLRGRLGDIGAGLLPKVLSSIESGEAHPTPQDEGRVTLAPPLEPRERAVRWSESAVLTDRRVRAFAPSPGAFALLPDELGRKRVKILEAEPFAVAPGGDDDARAPGEVLVASEHEGLVVAAGDPAQGGGALRLVTVQAEGTRPTEARAFLRGRRLEAGMRFLDGPA